MIDSKPTQVEGELNKCPPSHQKKTAAQTTVLYLLYVPPNAGSCIITHLPVFYNRQIYLISIL